MKKDEMHKRRYRLLHLVQLLAVAFVLAISGVAGLVFLGSLHDVVYSDGIVTPAVERPFYVPVAGVLERINVEEGDAVSKGQVLFQLNARELAEAIAAVADEIAEGQAAVALAGANHARMQIDPLPKEYRHVEVELVAAQKRRQRSQERYTAMKGLFDDDIIARVQLDQAEKVLLQDDVALRKLQQQADVLRGGLATRLLAESKEQLALAQARLAKLERKHKRLLERAEAYTILAPYDGVVSTVPKDTGVYYREGDLLLTFIASEQKIIQAYVDEEAIQDIELQQEARIFSKLYSYLDAGWFSGVVTKVENRPILQGSQIRYPVEILVTEAADRLRLGSSAEVRIMTGEKPIFQVLLGH